MGEVIGLAYGHVASNLGDLAINAGLAAVLDELGQPAFSRVVTLGHDARLVADSLKVFGDAQTVCISSRRAGSDVAVPAVEIAEVISFLADPAAWWSRAGLDGVTTLIVNGGEHIFDDPEGKNWAALAWRTLPIIAAREVGARLVVAPSTYGPVHSPFGDVVTRLFTDDRHGWAAREVASAEWLTGRRQRANQPLLDPAFFLPPRPPRPEGTERVLGIVPRLESYGLRVGTSRSKFVAARARQEKYRNSEAYGIAMEVALSRIAKGWRVILLVQTPSDRDLVDAIARDLAGAGHGDAVSVVVPTSLDDYRDELARLTVLLSARFHACILAAGVGVPSVGIYHDTHGHKMPGLYSQLGVPHLSFQTGRKDVRGSSREVDVLLDAAMEESRTLRTHVKRLRARTLTWYQKSFARPPRQVDDRDARMLMIGALADRLMTTIPEVTAAAVKSSVAAEIRGLRQSIDAQAAAGPA